MRPAVPADAEAIERIRVRGWQTAYRHVFPAEELDALPIDASRWVELLTDGGPDGQSCVVAEDDEEIAGWAAFGPSRHGDDCGELHGLYVAPERWGGGAGRLLIAHVERELARSWDEAVLWVIDDNPRARGFYERAGWEFDGARGSFPRFGVEAPVVRYRKRLKSSTSRG